eukprot:gene17096-22609_t
MYYNNKTTSTNAPVANTWSNIPSPVAMPKPPTLPVIVSITTNESAPKINNRFSSSNKPVTIDLSKSTTTTTYNQPNSDEVPQSVKNFIRRSLLSCNAKKEDIDEMTRELGKIVKNVKDQNMLQTYNWDAEPIPILPSKSTVSSSIASVQPSIDPNKPIKKRKSRWEADSNGNISISNNLSINTTNTLTISTDNGSGNNSNFKSISGVDKILTPDDIAMREKRANRFLPITKNDEVKSSKKIKSNIFESNKSLSSTRRTIIDLTTHEFDIEKLKIVGTCQTLEKEYFRLTSAPDPSTVRPLDILKKALKKLKQKWIKSEVEYIYICSQLKAIRQDLTVQNIRNEFMVDVYETHARIALECGDLNEYNQCQTQLKQLYHNGLKGCEMEFLAYRILYYVYLQGNKKYQNGSQDLAYILMSLTPEAKKNEAVSHALKIREAIKQENYHRFQLLYQLTPNMDDKLEKVISIKDSIINPSAVFTQDKLLL